MQAASTASALDNRKGESAARVSLLGQESNVSGSGARARLLSHPHRMEGLPGSLSLWPALQERNVTAGRLGGGNGEVAADVVGERRGSSCIRCWFGRWSRGLRFSSSVKSSIGLGHDQLHPRHLALCSDVAKEEVLWASAMDSIVFFLFAKVTGRGFRTTGLLTCVYSVGKVAHAHRRGLSRQRATQVLGGRSEQANRDCCQQVEGGDGTEAAEHGREVFVRDL